MDAFDKIRIVETEDGLFYPQFKPGFWWGWKFFVPYADSQGSISVFWLEEKDPGKAAKFYHVKDAQNWLDRFQKRVAEHDRDRLAGKQRMRDGVSVKRVIE